MDADIDGTFSINIPDSLFQDSISLVATYAGYMEHEITINMKENKNKKVVIELHPYGDGLLGDVIIIENKWWQFWKWF